MPLSDRDLAYTIMRIMLVIHYVNEFEACKVVAQEIIPTTGIPSIKSITGSIANIIVLGNPAISSRRCLIFITHK